MKRKHLINIILVLMSVSLVLLISMQSRLLFRSYTEKKEIIDRGVNEALGLAVKLIEKQDALMFVYDKMADNSTNNQDSIYPIDPYMFLSGIDPSRTQILNNNFQISITSTYDGSTHIFTFSDIAQNHFPNSGMYNITDIEKYFDEQMESASLSFEDIIEQLEKEYRLRSHPIEERFNSENISEILNKSLSQKGIKLDFEFAIADGKQKMRIQSDGFIKNMLEESYHLNLTPGNLFDNPDELYVYFPNKDKYVLQGIYAQLISSIIFTLIILITFGVTLYTVFKQKKLSEIKNDFINNMTHEFKTPIATIRLAADSIRNPKMQNNSSAIGNFATIISQETQRMNHHVEQVLQMALLEKQGIRVKPKLDNVHDLISDAIHNFELIIEERNGIISKNFKAENPIAYIDADTMLNVMNNLIDNAIKYSPEKLEIDISTYNKNDNFVIEVQDRGLGMNKDVQTHIFDRFYRANTGNVHNIKGFGLGLNYVKEIILAHHGQIKVKSSLGKGSTFIIQLPLNKKSKKYPL